MRSVALFAVLSAPGLALAAPATPRIAVIDSLPEKPAQAPPASAADTSTPDAARLAEARRLGTLGLAAYDQHDYDAAVERLTSAIDRHDAPSLRLYRARSYARLERWGAACEDFQAITRSPVVEGETPVAAEARAAAEPEGNEACARVAGHFTESAPAQSAATMSPADVGSMPVELSVHEQQTLPDFELDVSFFGSIHNEVSFSEEAFESYTVESWSVASRVDLSWYPFPEPLRDWFGVGASWEQDYGTGPFNYTKMLGSVMSRHVAGPARFGAQLGAGFLRPGLDVLNQRYILLQPSLAAGVRFGDLAADLSVAAVVPIEDVGASLYSDFSGYGLEGRVSLDYELWRWLGVQLSAMLSRLELELHLPRRGATVDGQEAPSSVSVVDRYASFFLSRYRPSRSPAARPACRSFAPATAPEAPS